MKPTLSFLSLYSMYLVKIGKCGIILHIDAACGGWYYIIVEGEREKNEKKMIYRPFKLHVTTPFI